MCAAIGQQDGDTRHDTGTHRDPPDGDRNASNNRDTDGDGNAGGNRNHDDNRNGDTNGDRNAGGNRNHDDNRNGDTDGDRGAAATTVAANATETPPGTPAAAAVVADETVSITESGYVPDTLTVPTGTTVGWTNDASTNQTVSATGGATGGFFDSGMLAPGDSYTYTFNAAGNYTYQSQTTGINGTIIVTA
ncbi:hypothetical protein [Methanoculleus chikugoensis]|uniref:cupredoxin domain-containing protein n=1 Tax=Methanoculleus chikugoensis TaxID=118126 RepID=UPI0006D1E509|nr:hypothetical protein [Methanoculleus chikugoensis]